MWKLILCMFFIQQITAFSDLCIIKECEQFYGPQDIRCQRKNIKGPQCLQKELKRGKEQFDLGKIGLHTYVTDNGRITFNISFTDIKWTDIDLRFKSVGHVSTCISYHIGKNTTIPDGRSFFYDCPWCSVDSEGKVATFEYVYNLKDKISSKNYIFSIPRHEKFEKIDRNGLELFLYVELTSPEMLVLFIQVPSQLVVQKLNITHYVINVYRVLYSENKRENLSIVSHEKATDGIIKFPYDVLAHGEHYFTVEPCFNQYCGVKSQFKQTVSPKIVIPNPVVLQVSIVGPVLFIFVVLTLLFYYMYSDKKTSSNMSEYEQDPNKSLFVYEPKHIAHVNTVTGITEKLKTYWNMDIMLDNWDIPGTSLKDPFRWFTESFYNASHIVFFISPDVTASLNGSVYKDLFNLGLRLTQEELSKKNSTKKFLVVKFPYSNKPIISELKNFKTYMLPSDLNSFLNILQNKEFLGTLVRKIKTDERDLLNQLNGELKNLIQQACLDMKVCLNEDISPSHTTEYKIIPCEEPSITIPKDLNTIIKPVDGYEYAYKMEDINLDGAIEEIQMKDQNDNKEDYKYTIDTLDL